ncbi:colicin D domain-containing protein [Amycolatopsis pigmentata]|uniref:Colicin D domain-containing protein n=1 Tax=Amycolatopsis pigmentata TaxID=450801 RepID=A0ABW5FKK6_9PSEU
MGRGPDGGPLVPVKIVPDDFHVVAQHFIDAQTDLTHIRGDLLTKLDAAQGAAGACDGAHQYQDGWAAAMDSILNDGFHSAFDLLGAIGQGIDVSALNHWNADHTSIPGQTSGGQQPWSPVTPNPWPSNTDFAVLTGASPWWMPGFLERYIPTADTSRLDDAAGACRAASAALRELGANLHASLQGLLSNNSSADLDELDQFWQRAAGSQSVLTGLPQALEDVASSLVDFRVWNDHTQEAIKDKIKNVIESLGAVGVLLGIGSVLTDGGLDAIIAAVVEALDFVGIDASGALAAPIAEVAATAATGLVAAGGAVAIAKGIEPAIQAAMSSTPNPNIESADATKISDELTDRGLPALKYPKKQLQSHYKHAKDFGIDQNWSNESAKAYEDALRKFADDPANTINTAGKYHGEPAILIYNQSTRVCEVLRPDGTYWTGWKLGPEQLRNVIERGSLGGG